ncbi:hypothetical protein ACEN2I_19635 [Flavobacterium sp. W22_SRS_FK3]|uniref:glycine-rich domain-containing protein n=1 Tax=Flavobacterium sp. W22_SRS_FK3 TaxID=3240275 RepID=UPI003F8EE9BD
MRLKSPFLLFFVFSSSMWAQTTLTFSTPTTSTFKVPAGVTSLNVECWGGGGSGGGVYNLVSLFGGGGGGGGAYSKVPTFVVTPGAVLNYKVGNGGIGVNGADGLTGETTNFSTVNALGGVGGKNGNSGNGAGGAGGIASTGTGTFYSGGAGALARTILVTVLSSGGGGGSAGTAANGNNASTNLLNANGGAAVTGGGAGASGMTLIGGGNGNTGSSPGGGGGGALGLLNSNFKGGNGGKGQIKVTYTCPTYALTAATTAVDVCTAIGSTSVVTLTGGSSLPNGDYVVTYNRSSPSLNGTGLTAPMSVTGGTGIGTFTAEGLTALGPSTITVTNLTSESCTNTISTNNTATITVSSASVGGTVTGTSSVCSGSTSGLLTLSGYTGTITEWQQGNDLFGLIVWETINHTSSTYTSEPLTETTYFRAQIKNGPCSAVFSTTFEVIVNPLPEILTDGLMPDVCFNGSAQQMAELAYISTNNDPTSYSISWSADGNLAGLANQPNTPFAFSSGGGNMNTIVIPAGVAANTYFGIMTIYNANCSVTQPVHITIVPAPSAPISGTVTEPTCANPTGSVILSGLPASTPSNVDIVIVQTGTVFANYTIPPTATYAISGLAPGNYDFTVEYTGSCTSPSVNVVVNNLVTNTYNLVGGWSNGTPTINQNLVFASPLTTAGGGAGNITGCSCKVNSGINVVINSDDTLTIHNEVVNSGGSLTFENNASLVQNNPDSTNSGDIIYKRTSTPMKNFDFTYWSSPVSGQTLFELSPNTLWDKYLSFTGTVWREEQYGTAVMTPGIGYIIRTPKAGTWPNGEVVAFPYSQKVEFIGVPNNGNISGQSVTAGNYYLIGNPYPSAISADAFLFSNPNPNNSAVLDGTIYFWTHNTPLKIIGSQEAYSSGDYASYNGVGGTATLSASSGGALPSGNIAAGQSFFALANADGTVIFNNEMRINSDNSQFFKPVKTKKTALLEKHRLWLNMTNKGGAFKQLLIGYIEGATNGYDSDFDGITFDGNAYIDFYSINLGSNLVIQGRALPFNNSDTVSLGYRTIIAGDFTISIDQADGMLSSQPVYLEDKLTNTINDLSQSDYTFTTVAGVFNNRFMLRYTNTTLAAEHFEHANNDVLVWTDNNILKLKSHRENINKVFIYDISGKLVYSDSEISSPDVIIRNLKLKNEVLVLKIILADTHLITKKVTAITE